MMSYRTYRSVVYRYGNLTGLTKTCRVRYGGCIDTLAGNRVFLQGYTLIPGRIHISYISYRAADYRYGRFYNIYLQNRRVRVKPD